MSNRDKARNKSQLVKGKLKAAVGQAAGYDSLRRDGKREQARADLKQAGQKVKDATRL